MRSTFFRTLIARLFGSPEVADRERFPGVTFLGKYVVEGSAPRFGGNGIIEIGEDVRFRAAPNLYAEPGGHIVIGARTLLNCQASIFSCERVEIGADCLIADHVAIFDTNFHQIDEGSAPWRGPVKIGRNVWIGYRAIILAGVEIGDHMVVGAGAVVTKSLPSGVVAAGNPARIIRQLTASEHFRRI